MRLVAISILLTLGVNEARVYRSTPCKDSNEVFVSGEPVCEKSCDDLEDETPCSEECVTGCFCRPGYVRNLIDGSCVRPCNCPVAEPTATEVPCSTPNKRHCRCKCKRKLKRYSTTTEAPNSSEWSTTTEAPPPCGSASTTTSPAPCDCSTTTEAPPPCNCASTTTSPAPCDCFTTTEAPTPCDCPTTTSTYQRCF